MFWTKVLYLSLSVSVLFAKPHHLTSGRATLSEDGSLLQVQTHTDRAILEWESFSIAQGETTKFLQPSETSAVLNRVAGNLPSHIAGTLLSNGHVYLINKHGVLFSQEAIVDTKSLCIATLDVSNAMFLEGKELLFSGDSDAAIVNEGLVKTKEGTFLIAPRIDNSGEVQGPLFCAAGREVLFQPGESSLLLIRFPTDQPFDRDHPHALGIRQSGKVDALHVVEQEGRIFLTSQGALDVSGTLQAETIVLTGEDIALTGAKLTGEEMYVGGGYQGKDPDIPHAKRVTVDRETELCADAIGDGDGGTIVVWSDEGTQFLGRASAKGGAKNGNGGLIEVSSPGGLVFEPREIATSAPCGKTGKLFLDPPDVTISNTDSPADVLATCAFNPGATNPVTINVATLSACLENSDVEINTSTTGSGAGANEGRITVSNALSWTAANTLTLTANESVIVNNAITSTNGSLVLTGLGNRAASYNAVEITNASAAITMTNGDVTISGRAGSRTGGNGVSLSRSMTAGGDIVFQNCRGGAGSTNFIHGVTITGGTISGSTITFSGCRGGEGTNNNRGVDISSSPTLSASTITFTDCQGGTATGSGFCRGVSIGNGAIVGSTSLTSAISITGIGGVGAGSENYGVGISGGTTQTTPTGTITIHGTGGGNASSSSSQNAGVLLAQGTVAGGASITVTGVGGLSTGGVMDGVIINSASHVMTCGEGTITFLDCIGGENSNSSARGVLMAAGSMSADTISFINCRGNGVSSSQGIFISGTPTIGATSGPNATNFISIEGLGSTKSNATSTNIGINLAGGTLQTTSSGIITLTGTGGGNASLSGSSNQGISITSGTLTAGTALTFAGTGGVGTGGSHHGVTISSTPTISFSGSNPTLSFSQCSGGSGGNNNRGVSLSSSLSFADGTISFSNVTGGGSGTGNHGVFVANTFTLNAPTITATNVRGGAGTTTNHGFYVNGGTVGSTSADPIINISASTLGTGATNYGIVIDNSGDVLTRNGSIALTGNSGTSYGIAVEGSGNVQSTGNDGSVTLQSSGSIGLGASTIQTGPGNLLIKAGTNIEATGAAVLSTGTGSLRLVVDDLFPTPLGIGQGRYLLRGATISSTSGVVQFYSALPELDVLPALVNGVPSNSVVGIFGVYFPDGVGGTPFELFYKYGALEAVYLAALSEAYQRWTSTSLGGTLEYDEYAPDLTPKDLILRIPSLVRPRGPMAFYTQRD